MQKRLTIAIDGYSSSGKSTLARQIADCLSYLYIDSGAMYRAVTLYFLNKGIDYTDENQVKSAMKDIRIEFEHDNSSSIQTILNGKNVSKPIRSLRVSAHVSEVATIPVIREFLVGQQRAMRGEQGIVMDGRDISTVVFPDADVKFFITADIDERVKRRYKELLNKSINTDKATVKRNLKERDYTDSHRDVSPLIQAPDAILIDNTHMSKKEQLLKAVETIAQKFPEINPKNCI